MYRRTSFSLHLDLSTDPSALLFAALVAELEAELDFINKTDAVEAVFDEQMAAVQNDLEAALQEGSGCTLRISQLEEQLLQVTVSEAAATSQLVEVQRQLENQTQEANERMVR